MAKKIYVLDTNVYLSDHNAINTFKTNDIVIPLKVLEEIDKHKKRQDVVGANARQTIRVLDGLREGGNLHDGVRIGKGKGNLSVKGYDKTVLPEDLSLTDPDNQILATALTLIRDYSDRDVIVVSQDINMRVKCDSLKVTVENYETNQVVDNAEEIYTGTAELVVADEVIDAFYAGAPLVLSEQDAGLFPNQYVTLISSANPSKTALARFQSHTEPLAKIKQFREGIWEVKARNREQQMAIDALMNEDIKVVSIVGNAGCGKTVLATACGLKQVLDGDAKYKKLIVARPVQPMGRDLGFLPGPQPLDAKIATPTGWTTMGELSVGSEVITKSGKPTKVLGVYPKGIKTVYKMTTTDGTSTECCEDHLWTTQTHSERKHGKQAVVRTTKEIIDTLRTDKSKVNHFLPRNEPVQYKETTLPLSPYTLGCLLGDGSFGDSINLTNTDLDLIKRAEQELKQYGCSLQNDGKTITYNIRAELFNNKPARQVSVTSISDGETTVYPSIGKALEELDINRSTLHSRCEKKVEIDGFKYEFLETLARWQNPIKNIIYNLGLSDKKAWEKFIPEQYKYQSSIQDRVDLLRGLMDTDGTVKKSGEASFTTTSKQMALDLIEVVRSLGGRATLRERNRVGKTSVLNGRAVITRRVSYEFTVSLPSEINPFYISRKANRHSCRFMHGVGIASIEEVGEKEVQCILVEDESHLYLTNDFIVTHNTMEEKLLPWLAPIQDNLEALLGNDKEHLRMLIENGTIEMEAISYIRGRSISNAFILIDEAQNLSVHEIKTILTRVGENTKIVLTGDIKQVDVLYLDELTNGLTHAAEKFKNHKISAHVFLKKGERSAVATLASEIL